MATLPPQITGPVTAAVAGGVTGHALGQAAQRKPTERGSVPQIAAIATGAGLTLAQPHEASLLNPALAAAAIGWLLQGGWQAALLGLATPYVVRHVPPLINRLEGKVEHALPMAAGGTPAHSGSGPAAPASSSPGTTPVGIGY